MTNWPHYQIKAERLSKHFIYQTKQPKVQVGLRKDTSHLFRERKPQAFTFDVRSLNKVISVDANQLIAEVEGMTTYEDLVRETLKHGCLPAVVPELKSITVGGALSGIGMESSSFRYGLVHETITEIDVLTGRGDIITCNAHNEYKDLFFAFPNAYGTLGYALRVQVKLIPVKKYIKLTRLKFYNAASYYRKLKDLSLINHEEGTIAYIEGTLFSENELYITLGEFVDEAPHTSNYKYMNIYYRSIQNKKIDYLTVADYIWRWDSDGFWCSKAFMMQNPVSRFLFGKWMLQSKTYYSIRQYIQNNALLKTLYKMLEGPKETVIQNVMIPIENAASFLDFFNKKIQIKPIWNCPIMTYNPAHDFTFFPKKTKHLYVNFGFWATVPTHEYTPAGHYNRLIEAEVQALGGIKCLNADVYFSQEAFRKMYNYDAYYHLKEKYDPNHFLSDIYTKCVKPRHKKQLQQHHPIKQPYNQ